MMAKMSCAGTTRSAARITCPNSAWPPTSCNTLGSCDFSLVPLPAAIMATATRGADSVWFIGTFALADKFLEAARLLADFLFIRLNIPRPCRNGYFKRHISDAFGPCLQVQPEPTARLEPALFQNQHRNGVFPPLLTCRDPRARSRHPPPESGP